MPHGIEAIKEHLINVDNVPLLVSLFTDATPETIKSMVEIFRENGEIVLTVGAGYRAYNQHIYNVSNLSTSVSYVPNVLSFIPAEEKDVFAQFPPLSSQCLTRSDLRLAFDLVGLGTVNILQLRSLDPALLLANLTRDVDVAQVQHVHLSVLLETIRKGRVLLLNKQQALAFFIISVMSLSLWNIVAQFVPLSVSPICPPPIAIAFSLFYLPAICLAMLFNDGHENIMKNTPRKANLVLRPKDTSRFYNYLVGRVGVAVGGMFMCGYFAAASVHQGNESFFHSLDHFHSVFEHKDSFTLDFRKFCLVQDVMSHAALLAIFGQSLTLLVRGQQPIKDFPWPSYYVEYYFTLLVILLVHAVFMALRSALRNCDISGFGVHWLTGVDCNADDFDKVSYGSLHGLVWGMLLLSLVANMLVGFYVNHYDGHFYRRYLQFLRLEFDTRLGMHSPR
ncbi:hypothetical protein EON65_18115 [archaeon]|nr:MAG: hypothetical protein EON65_18115 [archaeon]